MKNVGCQDAEKDRRLGSRDTLPLPIQAAFTNVTLIILRTGDKRVLARRG